MNNDYLAHYGTKRHSGRYPWGSGKDPKQSLRSESAKTKVKSMTDQELMAANRRSNLEREYLKNNPSKISKMKKQGKTIAKTAGVLITSVATAKAKPYIEKAFDSGISYINGKAADFIGSKSIEKAFEYANKVI
jgi:hypothetical protein|nr:MAG TPA: RNA dependent RNA polymerase [Caudoviricetes sp.]